MFVTKLLRDKKGQCHSLPLLYLILAEALHVKAWLAYSPEHAYIKTQDAQGTWFNFETTNGHYSTDTWLLGSAYVKAEAMKNKIYLDTLSKRETVAACLVDLAMGYKEKFGFDAFILEAVNKALEYSPRNIYALQLKADYQTYLFRYVVKQLNYPPKSELYRYPKAYELFKIAGDLHNLIDQLGYEEMPQTMYESWLQSFEREKNKQTIQVIKP